MRYSPFRHIGSLVVRRRPIQLTVFLTRRCNAACPFCFYVSNNNPAPEGPELSLGELERTARRAGRLLWLAFSGGEIFLRPDLEAVVETFYRHNRPAIILLPSNGLAPRRITSAVERIADACPRSTVAVKLSLDGPAAVHDRLRGVPDARDRVLDTLARLRELARRRSNLEIGINSVLCSANAHVIDETVDAVGVLEGVRTHTVSLVRGAPSDPSMKEVPVDVYGRVARRLEERARAGAAPTYRFSGARLKAAQDVVQRRLIEKILREKRPALPCTAGRLTAVVTESGDVYPCEAFDRRLGNLRDDSYDLRALLRRPAARRAVGRIRRDGCFCTHECYMMMNILFSPRLLPRVLLESLRPTWKPARFRAARPRSVGVR